MPHHKPNNIQTMSTPVHQWLQNCSAVSAATLEEVASFPLAEQHASYGQRLPKHEICDPYPHSQSHLHEQQQQQQQHQQQQHKEPVQPYTPYSHILDDSDKELLATIQLGPGSADSTLSPQNTNTTIATTTTSTVNDQQITMYSIPALLPGTENRHHHPSVDWEPKQQQQLHHLQPQSQPTGGGYHSPLIRNLTPMTELESMSSGQSNNGNDDSHLMSSYVFDNHNHHNDVRHQHQALHNDNTTTTNYNHSNSDLTVSLPGQETTPPHHHQYQPSAILHNAHNQHHSQHHHQHGAVDQLSAAFLHLTHLYHPLSLSPSASPPPFPGSSCSPSGTPFSSSYPPSSPSQSLAFPSPHLSTAYSIVPTTYHDGSNKSIFGKGIEPGMHSFNWSPAATARSLATRSSPVVTRCRSQALLEKQSMSTSMVSSSPGLPHSPMMTRRRSQALLSQNTLLTVTKRSSVPSSMATKPLPLPFTRLTTSSASMTASTDSGGAHSPVTTSPLAPLNPSGIFNSSITPSPRPLSSSSSVYTPLTCEICKKEYANNSTLRRHARIHAYANASTATRKICNPPRPSSTSDSFATMGINSDMSSSMHGSGGSPGLNTKVSSNMSSTLAAVNTHLLSSFWPYRDAPSPSTFMTANTSASPNGNAAPTPTSRQLLLHQSSVAASAAAVLIAGYNPGYDPTIRKPECVGCNKPFARRDTVILHIKNQKDKWDQLCALLRALAASASNSAATTGNTYDGGDVSNDGDEGDEGDAVIKNNGRCTSNVTKGAGWKAGSTAAQRRRIRQKKAHPFREAEKLWQSTLQKKKVHFGAYKKTPSTAIATAATSAMVATVKRASVTEAAGRKSKPLSFGDEGSINNSEFCADMYVVNDHQPLPHHHYQTQGDVEMLNAYMADNISNNNDNELNEMRGDDEVGWPSQKALEKMDNQTKILWMIKMAVVPPCWSERKVRIFGLQGEVEESVLLEG